MISKVDGDLALIYGTRPELIKLFPLFDELRKSVVPFLKVSTGQQGELLGAIERSLDVKPDISLPHNYSPTGYTEALSSLLDRLDRALQDTPVRGVIVQGDTLTALAGALVGFLNKVPVFHLEAGLRSTNMLNPFPEEAVRQMISRIAQTHFCPTGSAAENLLREGIESRNIVVSGNTVVDAVRLILERQEIKSTVEGSSPPRVIVSIHRKEVHGSVAQALWGVFGRLVLEHPNLEFHFLIHSNPNVRPYFSPALQSAVNVVIHEGGLAYPEFIRLLESSSLVCSDSGGLQEETAFLGKPIVIMRELTERPEALADGAELIGISPEKVYERTSKALALVEEGVLLREPSEKFGRGFAAQRVVDWLSDNT